MKIKEFFNPAIAKIVIFVILLFPIFILVISLFNFEVCVDGFYYSNSTEMVLMRCEPGERCICSNYDTVSRIYLTPIQSIILTLILSYLISCLIVMFYNKLKHKNKNDKLRYKKRF